MALLDMFILAAAAFGVSILGSIIGVGGGFLLMPFLLFMYPEISHEDLTFISLFAVLVNAIAATRDYLRMKRVDVKSGLILGLCTVPTSIAARFLLGSMERTVFSQIFGMVLIVIGLFILWSAFRSRQSAKSEKKRDIPSHWTHRKIVDADGEVYEYAYSLRAAVPTSVGAGFFGSFMGLGGGIFLVPVLTQLLGFPTHVATSTSIMVLSFNAATALITDVIRHVFSGQLGELPLLSACAAGVGAYLGARCGTRLSGRMTGRGILALLAAALMLAGCKLALIKSAPPAANEVPSSPTENAPDNHDS